MPRKQSSSDSTRRIALCYVRQSVVKDATDQLSPERQRANIQAVCDREGWIAEWYEDVKGRRSGQYEHTRPGWLALKTRLNDRDVAALIANDLSRLHRKGWRVADLIHMAEERGFRLILADPNKKFDLDTSNGRLLAQVQALLDEWYSLDTAERHKANIAHRKAQGKSIGLPPFGTVRDKTTGFLIPSFEGAWLMPDGSWKAGSATDQPPVKDAVWRGYYQCAEKILQLYAEDTQEILALLHSDGWAFRDRWANPAPVSADVIRRVIANWAEYGGFVSSGRARQRHPKDFSPDEILPQLVPERSIFPIELLKQVALMRYQRVNRQNRQPNQIERRNAVGRIYPLSGLLYCAACESEANRQGNDKLRTTLGGHHGRSYTHPGKLYCGVVKKSVRCDRIEAAFLDLLMSLGVNLNAKAALRFSDVTVPSEQDETVIEQRRVEAVGRCKQRIQAAVDLYAQTLISRQEFYRRIEENERELVMLETGTGDVSELGMRTALCVQALETLKRVWQSGNDEDKRGGARQLFDWLIYDLDAQQITDFQLKLWARDVLELAERGD